MNLSYHAVYDDIAGVTITLHDKIYEIMEKYNLQDIQVDVRLTGLEFSEDKQTGDIIETHIPIMDENLSKMFIQTELTGLLAITDFERSGWQKEMNKLESNPDILLSHIHAVEAQYGNATIVGTHSSIINIPHEQTIGFHPEKDYFKHFSGYSIYLLPDYMADNPDFQNTIYIVGASLTDLEKGDVHGLMKIQFVEEVKHDAVVEDIDEENNLVPTKSIGDFWR